MACSKGISTTWKFYVYSDWSWDIKNTLSKKYAHMQKVSFLTWNKGSIPKTHVITFTYKKKKKIQYKDESGKKKIKSALITLKTSGIVLQF